MPGRVVLAFSGGLNARVALHALRMRRGYEVITFTPNLGQRADALTVSERSLDCGATSAHVGDLRERFGRDYILPALRAGSANHDASLCLAPALARPLVVAEVVRIAQQEGCRAIAHASTGKGNDQIRFASAAAAIAPDIEVVHPLRELDLHDFAQMQSYAKRHDVPCDLDDRQRFSIRETLWGVVCDTAEDLEPWSDVPSDLRVMTVRPEDATDEAAELVLSFDSGVPIAIDGKQLDLIPLIRRLNDLGGKHAVGRVERVEDRLLGIKTRDVYEAPAAAILHRAKEALEQLVLSRELLYYKRNLSQRWLQLVYDGHWFNELRCALDAFFRYANDPVSGEVRIRLFKGSATASGCRSPFTLFNAGRSGSSGEIEQGFMRLYSASQQARPEAWLKDISEAD